MLELSRFCKPTLKDWLQAWPRLKKQGPSGYKGPCPVCGGRDRFFVTATGTFGCRGCRPGKNNPAAYEAILQKVGLWNDKPLSNGHLNGSPPPQKRWQYTGSLGSAFEVVRTDGYGNKKMWQEPVGVRLKDDEQWHVYRSGEWNDSAAILIVEGEKTADAAKSVLPDTNVCTWSRSARDTDWSFCKDKDVFCWPDNDMTGFQKAREVTDELRKHAPKSIRIVQAINLMDPDDIAELKDDAADYVKRGQSLDMMLDRAWPLDENNMALRPIVSISDDGMMKCFRFLGFDVRYNLRSMRTDIYSHARIRLTDLPDKQWHPLTDRIAAALAEHIRKNFVIAKPPRNKAETWMLATAIFGSDRWQTCLNANLARAEVDPFSQWLKELKPAPSPRLDGWLADLFDVHPDSRQFVRWASRYLLLGAVQRTQRPGAKIDEIPVFVGKQGLGKSALGRAILPPEFRNEGHGDALVLADDPKKFAESLQGKIIVEASEMAGLGRADLERLKSNITRQNDGSVRLAYRRNPESTPRRAVFYGTSNDHECLPNDATGNRRFVVLELEGDHARQSVESYFDKHRNELWAAALHLHQQGERANLPRDLFSAQRIANEGYRRSDIIVEDEVARLDPAHFSDGGTLKDITLLMCDHDYDRRDRQMNTTGWGHRLGKALNAQGWQLHRMRVDGRVSRLWFPPFK